MKNISNNLKTEIENKTCIVKFGAEWCAPCHAIAPTLTKISEDLSIDIYSVDIDEDMESATLYNVRSVPTLIFFKNGQPKQVLVGNRSYEDIVATYKSMAE